MFVAYHVKFIREDTELTQWKYVPLRENPANDAPGELKILTTSKDKRWIGGHDFLYQPEPHWPKQPPALVVHQDNNKVWKVKYHTITINAKDTITALKESTSQWLKMQSVVATMLVWCQRRPIMVEDLQFSEYAI